MASAGDQERSRAKEAYRKALEAHREAVKVKAAADPEGVAGALGIRQAGGRWFCPSCQPNGGRTPDLSLKDSGLWKCWKCGHGGDLFALVELAKALDFKAAAAWLEDYTGIHPPDPPPGLRWVGSAPGRAATTAPRRVQADRATVGKSPRRVEPSCGASPGPQVEREAVSGVLEAFLAACRPVEGKPLEWLTVEREVAPEVVERLRLRWCGREYLDVLAALVKDHGADALLAAGLLTRRKGQAEPVGTFAHYHGKRAGFLVIPYLIAGRPVYVKARVPIPKAEAERRRLPRFLNPKDHPVQLYNVDALADRAPEVWVCEGESDTWAALTAGKAAVGSPGAGSFKPEWVELFRKFAAPVAVDEERAAILEHEAHLSREAAERQAAVGPVRSTVFLVLDADQAGQNGADQVAGMFTAAGLPAPRRAELPPGMDLADYLRGGRPG